MRLLLELGYRVGYVFVDGCGDNEGEEIGIVQVGVLEMREHRRWQLESSELTELRQQVETVQ